MISYQEAKALQTRADKEILDLTREECEKLDAYIKLFAINKFENVLRALKTPGPLRKFLIMIVRAHFGSVEVNNLLLDYKCYPDFID